LTALQACARMATVMELEAVRLEMLPVLTDLAADIVPNIRFNVAKEMRAVAPVCGRAVYEAQIAPILALLLEDDDRDVRFYAQQASRELEEEFARSSSSRALTAK
jgi:serine/threonine-protein phosphatase 2A regulatory subunit A